MDFVEAVLNALYEFKEGTKVSQANRLSAKDARGKAVIDKVEGRPLNDREANVGTNNLYAGLATPALGNTQSYKDTKQFFPYNMDKVYLTMLLEAAVKNASSSQPTSKEFFESDSSKDITDEKIFYRKAGNTTSLFTKDDAGQEIEVQKGSKAFLELTASGNCFTTGYKGSEADCYNLVKNCLAGKDIRACKDAMKDKKWGDDVDSKVNPAMAMDLLNSFGFRTESVNVAEVGLTLKQYESSSKWLQNLQANYTDGSNPSKLNDAAMTSIAGNSQLIGYLDRLVAKINRNPAILNPGYTGKDTLSTNPNAFVSTQLSKYGLLPKQVVSASGVPSLSSVIALQNTVNSNRNVVAVYYGMSPNGLIFQRGGGIAEYLENARNDSTVPLRLSKIVSDSFESFVGSLRNHGKDLDAGDRSHIQKLIDDLREKEDKLFKAAIYTDKYIRLLSVYGQEDGNKVLDFNHIAQFVDKRNSYFTKVGKKQDDLLSILKALAEATQTETKVESKSVTNFGKSKNFQPNN